MEDQLLGSRLWLSLKESLTANHVGAYNIKVDQIFNSDLGFTDIVLDLKHVLNIDSVGVTFVIGLFKRTEASGRSFSVSNASSDILSLFRLMKLDQFFKMND
ncbi:MAG TPA: hypothetical protein DCS67_03280 [Clostridiales bacterium UBA8960]|jgi:anti-anti-sigma factor|nr:hypothetical protein [Clostridiales bacterium UBA8960]